MDRATLDRLKSRGFTFSDRHEELADMQTRGEKPKTLSIKFKSHKIDKENHILVFEVTSPVLKNTNATIFVEEIDKYFNDDVLKNKITLKSNSVNIVTISFNKNLNFTESILDDGNTFKATITCDAFSAVSPVFSLINSKAKEEEKSIEKCLCKKSTWTSDDLKFIVTQLRKKDKILSQQQYNGLDPYYIDKEGKLHSGINKKDAEKLKYKNYKLKTSFYDRNDDADGKPVKDRLFFYDTDEDDEKVNFNLELKYANYETFAKYLEDVFKKYNLIKCIQKIHFMAQIYVETNRFRTTVEHEPRSYYSGGKFYGGRGLKQITHDYNYLAYYDVTEGKGKGKNLYSLYYNNRLSNFDKRKGKVFVESVEDFNTRTKNEFISTEEMNKFIEFVHLLSTSIYYASDSAGWYWDKNKLNNFATDDEKAIIIVSAKVNNPSASDKPSGKGINELENRKLYFQYLKEIFDYENCN